MSMTLCGFGEFLLGQFHYNNRHAIKHHVRFALGVLNIRAHLSYGIGVVFLYENCRRLILQPSV